VPRYYFDFITTSGIARDAVGTPLADDAAAKAEATEVVGEWIKDHASPDGTKLKVAVRVAKQSNPLFVVVACVRVMIT
jgi:hypothetical protein